MPLPPDTTAEDQLGSLLAAIDEAIDDGREADARTTFEQYIARRRELFRNPKTETSAG